MKNILSIRFRLILRKFLQENVYFKETLNYNLLKILGIFSIRCSS